MAENAYDGLNDNLLRNARDISDSMADIASSASRLNTTLQGVDGYTAGINNRFKTIRDAANKVASAQEAAKGSAKGTAQAILKQKNLLSEVRVLNIAIDKLYNAAQKATGETRDNLLQQGRNLSAARDSAQELANTYGKIAESSASLDKSTKNFDFMGQVANKYFGANFAKPFEAASAASREQAYNNAKIKAEQELISDTVSKYGNTLTKAKLEELGLTKITGKTSGAAAKNALLSYKKGLKTQSAMGAGFKAMGPILSKALGPLMWVKIAVDAIKFIIDIFISANKQAVELARTMGTSVNNADLLRQRFRDIRALTENTRNNLSNLIQAQSELNQEFGAALAVSDATLDSQTFLTKRLMISGNEAAKLNVRFETMDENAMKSVERIRDMGQEFADTNKIAVPLDVIMKSVSTASGQIAASFGFSNEKIAAGVLQVRKFGLNLQQAQNISKGLLDFQSSIENEMELELLTGKALNFERARALAAQGKYGDATEEVMKQLSQLTEEQRQLPFIMDAAAKAASITTDELADAYLIQQNNTKAAEKYYKIRASGDKEAIKKWKAQAALEQATMEDIERRVAAGEAFAEAMEDVKQQFVGLVDGGYIQILIDAITAFANKLDFVLGTSKRLGKEAYEKIQESGTDQATKDKASLLQKVGKGPKWWEYVLGAQTLMTTGVDVIGLKTDMSRMANKELMKMAKEAPPSQVEPISSTKTEENVPLATGGIVTQPTRALVGEAGAEAVIPLREFYAKMDELISVVKQGGDVFMDGAKVGRATVLAGTNLS